MSRYVSPLVVRRLSAGGRRSAHVPVPVCSLAWPTAAPAARRGPAPAPVPVSPCGVRPSACEAMPRDRMGGESTTRACINACARLLDRLQPLPHAHRLPTPTSYAIAMPRPGPCPELMPVVPRHVCHVRRTQDLVICGGRLARRPLSAATQGFLPKARETNAPGCRLPSPFPSQTRRTFSVCHALSGSLKIRCSNCFARSSILLTPKSVSRLSAWSIASEASDHHDRRQGRKGSRTKAPALACIRAEETHRRPNSWCECDAGHGEGSIRHQQ